MDEDEYLILNSKKEYNTVAAVNNFILKIKKRDDEIFAEEYQGSNNLETSEATINLMKEIAIEVGISRSDKILDKYIKTYTFIRNKLEDFWLNNRDFPVGKQLSQNEIYKITEEDLINLESDFWISENIKPNLFYAYNYGQHNFVSKYGGIDIIRLWVEKLPIMNFIYNLNSDITDHIMQYTD